MSLRIRRGTDTQRRGVTLDLGEIAWATNTGKLYVGDGITQGGLNILASSAGNGLEWNETTQQLDYNGALGTALQNVSEDLNPQLGGNLDLNNKTINGTGTVNMTGNISATALSLSTGLAANLPLNSKNITGSGNIDITGAITATGAIQGSTLTATTGLGANLALNGKTINGTGTISITGGITASSVTVNSTLVMGSQASITGGPVTFGAQQLNLVGDAASTNLQWISFITNSNNANFAPVTFAKSRGTILSPTTVSSGDALGGLQFAGFTGSAFTIAGSIRFKSTGTISAGVIPGVCTISVSDAAGSAVEALTINGSSITAGARLLLTDGTETIPSLSWTTDGSTDTGFYHPADGVIGVSINGVEKMRMDPGGFRTTGFMKAGSFAGSGDYPTPGENGMIIYDSITNHFVGYANGSWVQLDN